LKFAQNRQLMIKTNWLIETEENKRKYQDFWVLYFDVANLILEAGPLSEYELSETVNHSWLWCRGRPKLTKLKPFGLLSVTDYGGKTWNQFEPTYWPGSLSYNPSHSASAPASRRRPQFGPSLSMAATLRSDDFEVKKSKLQEKRRNSVLWKRL
jgi:hypothetical protein